MIRNLAKYIAVIIVATGFGDVFALDGDTLLRKADAIRAPAADFTFNLEIATSNDSSQELKVHINDTTKGLVRYIRPVKLAGRSILFIDSNMWVYVPGTRRALRISPQQRVLGGVSSADVARTVFSIDYVVKDMEEIDGDVVLKLHPNTDAAAYKRIHLTVDSSGSPQNAVFFVGGDRKLKTMYFEDYRDVLGAMRPTKLRVLDHLNNDATTTMIYSDFKNIKTPTAWFQPNNLSRF